MRPLLLAAVASLAFAASAELVLAQGQAPPCMNDLMPLRDAVQKEGMAVKAVIDKKAERGVICTQLKKYTAAEAKFVKFLEANAGWCGIPGEVLTQVKGGHKRSVALRDKACSGGPAGAGMPAGPGLSEALGTSRSPAPLDTSKSTGRGTFDTLSGNALAR